jgi:heme-degrading monooxygenase HmoA
MPFISITRLRVRSLLYLPPFLWHAIRSMRQAQRAPGFLGGKTLREARNAFWTLTAWQDAAAMNAFRISGAHRLAMPKLLSWCDEASVAHWTRESPELPTWPEVHRRMIQEGKPSKVNYPSADQNAYRIPAPEPGHRDQILKPAK